MLNGISGEGWAGTPTSAPARSYHLGPTIQPVGAQSVGAQRAAQFASPPAENRCGSGPPFREDGLSWLEKLYYIF